ncbi:hypothetical protein GCM10025864_25720 [Luteimicrobium album]|uniref:Uncharacterized protein n=1 Tax=Luteimicrobium album TaxID=1054550 RepID=A0ABQ6I3S4_9MICO|nr:hypothetical protein GCM10025864_25720 [Luteimicrobium album]
MPASGGTVGTDDDVPSVPGDATGAVGESAVVAGAVVDDTEDGAGDEPVHPASASAAAAPTAASRGTDDLPG